MPKEAVVVILDANPSMLTPVVAPAERASSAVSNGAGAAAVAAASSRVPRPNPQHPPPEEQQRPSWVPSSSGPPTMTTTTSTTTVATPKTRFDCAKEVALALISDLMIRSKTNEVSVVVLHTPRTNNYYYDPEHDNVAAEDADLEQESEVGQYPNLVELSGNGAVGVYGLKPPLPALLRTIQALAVVPDDAEAEATRRIGGDFVSGILYAADTLVRKTGKRKYNRRIIVVTDAEHKIQIGTKHTTEEESESESEETESQDSDNDSDTEAEGGTASRIYAALEQMRDMDCRLEVVGMGFQHTREFAPPVAAGTVKQEENEHDDENKKDRMDTTDDDDTDNENMHADEVETTNDDSDDDDNKDADDDEEEDPQEKEKKTTMLAIKRTNEDYMIRLAQMTGGYVYASEELTGMLAQVLGSRVVNKPSQRKVCLEMAGPDLVFDDVRFYLLASQTGSTTPLTKKMVQWTTQKQNNQNKNKNRGDAGTTVEDEDADDDEDDEKLVIRTNALGQEMFQEYESFISHYSTDDVEGEELLFDRLSYAYRFGSDLIPFGPLDDAGLRSQHPSPVKITIQGYMHKEQIAPYHRIAPPYVVTGHESRRCCAAISALARGLQRTDRVAIATFVKTKDKDPILCGLYPLLEEDYGENTKTNNRNKKQEPLRLVMMQLPFNTDIKHLTPNDFNTEEELIHNHGSSDDNQTEFETEELLCDTMIDQLMLPKDVLDYKHTPNHKVRSFYKTVVNRILDKSCEVVSTRIDATTGLDSMDTPPYIIEKARPAVRAFYESIQLQKINKHDDGTKRKK